MLTMVISFRENRVIEIWFLFKSTEARKTWIRHLKEFYFIIKSPTITFF